MAHFEDSVSDMPVLEETFCDVDDIPFEPYHGHIKHLLKDKSLRKGKIFRLYPPDAMDFSKGYK